MIEPYYKLNKDKYNHQKKCNYISKLHQLQRPYLLSFEIFRENVDFVAPTINDMIRGYQIDLNSIPNIRKLKTITKNVKDQSILVLPNGMMDIVRNKR